ncbi:phage tail assembly protein [Morganella morganii]|uniref:phage tail assembly protein n=1 Tax=Morganella morganii TaxID=582 RepID=UPI000F843E11|nr:phage tail assembly protein [Morganella morganii]EKU5844083.1 phage tail assembly protein [Morganella morganii]MCF1266605.1 phage tail assembly protein [Morganella morganii]RTY22515.1 phage tail assembly protein [Morganella morganii subsp. morganii]
METTKTITLSKPLESNDGKVRYEEVNLREPCLFEVEQFYNEMDKTIGSLPAMRLLIVLVSGVPDQAVKRMAISDFVECRDFLMGFLTLTPGKNISK